MERKKTYYPEVSDVKKQTCYVLKEKNEKNKMCNILNALLQIPPDYKSAEQHLKTELLTTQEVSELAWSYLQECLYEDDEDPYLQDYPVGEGTVFWKEPRINRDWHSAYLTGVFSLLLDYGLDLNSPISENNCILSELPYIVNGYVAADTIKLWFENGGSLYPASIEEPIYDDIAFKVWFDAIEMDNRRRYDSLMHCWFVLLAYGGRPYTGVDPVDVYPNSSSDGYTNFDLRMLKNHRNYYFGITHGKERTIHIFDKRTFWEVARM